MAKTKKIILKEEDLKDSKESSILFHNIIKASLKIPIKKNIKKTKNKKNK